MLKRKNKAQLKALRSSYDSDEEAVNKKQRMVNMNMNKTTFVFTYFYLSVKADFKEEEEHFVQLFVINNLGRRKI